MNRVENQNEPKLPQSGGRLGSFWFSTRPSADTASDYNLRHAHHALNSACARYYSMPVSAVGRVEHQKLNQTAALLSFG